MQAEGYNAITLKCANSRDLRRAAKQVFGVGYTDCVPLESGTWFDYVPQVDNYCYTTYLLFEAGDATHKGYVFWDRLSFEGRFDDPSESPGINAARVYGAMLDGKDVDVPDRTPSAVRGRAARR